MTTTSFEETITRLSDVDLDAGIARAAWMQKSAEDDAERADRNSTPNVRIQVEQIGGGNIRDLSAVISQLIALWKSPVKDHRGRLRPETAAFELAIQLLVDASIALKIDHKRPVPHGCVSPDFEGGIRVEWVRARSSVHLVIPANSSDAYLYHEVNDDYGTDDKVTAEGLASRLQRITD